MNRHNVINLGVLFAGCISLVWAACTFVGTLFAVVLATVLAYGIAPSLQLISIPGPMPIPFMGNMHQISSTGFPTHLVRWAAEYGGLYKIVDGRQATVVVATPDLVKDVTMRHFKQFMNRPVPPGTEGDDKQEKRGLLFAQGEYWRGVRNTLLPMFHSTQLRRFEPLMRDAAETLATKLDSVADTDASVDMFDWFGLMTMEVIGSTAFGTRLDTQKPEGSHHPSDERLVRACATMFAAVSQMMGRVKYLHDIFPPLAWIRVILTPDLRRVFRERKEALPYIDKRGLAIVNERRTSDGENAPQADFVALMLQAKNKATGKMLTDKQIAAHSRTFLLAGYETTANTLSYCLYLIAQHPEVEKKMVAEIDLLKNSVDASSATDLTRYEYLDAVVKEALRIFPPAPATVRIANEACVIGGVNIPAGTQVIIPIYALHHDPTLFESPESFRPESFLGAEDKSRHAYAYLPFGAGPRMCIGYKMALEEVKLTLIKLYERFTFELAPNMASPLKIRPGITYSPIDGVHVRVNKRK